MEMFVQIRKQSSANDQINSSFETIPALRMLVTMLIVPRNLIQSLNIYTMYQIQLNDANFICAIKRQHDKISNLSFQVLMILHCLIGCFVW